jgi:ferredoxin
MSLSKSIGQRGAGVVIAGGGLAAQRASETLRRNGYDGAIRVIARKPHAPYDHPPLSKEFLAGELDERALEFRPHPWYAEHDVDLLLGERATGLDAPGRKVLLADRSRLSFEQLLIATGSAPRRLPSTERYENVYELRTRDDARTLQTPAAAPPSFWSDQHGVRIQYVGDTHGADRLEIEGPRRQRLHRTLHPQRPARRGAARRTPTRGPRDSPTDSRRGEYQQPREERRMTLIPHIDELACAAHGDCALAAPEVFTIEDIAVVTGNGSDEAILKAARECPAGAIIVADEQTGEQIYP